MNAPSETLLEASTRVVYSIDRITPELKVFWNKFLLYYFADKLIDTQIRQRQIAAASKRFPSVDQAKAYVASLDEDVRHPLFVLLSVLHERALKEEDWMAAKQIDLAIAVLDDSKEGVDARYRTEAAALIAGYRHFENPQLFIVSGSIAILTLDYLSRWFLIIVANNFSLSTNATFLLNALPTVLFAIIAWMTARRHASLNHALVRRHLTEPFRLQIRYTTWQYTVITFYFITGIFITTLLQGLGDPGQAFLPFLALAVYYYYLLVIMPAGKLSEESILSTLHRAGHEEKLDADQNDEAIVKLETQLVAQTGRLEAYVLESALFGALAFSGFLQIIATDLISFADLEQFAESFFQVSRAFVTANWPLYHTHAAVLSTKQSLFCLVSIETLVCSGLFLAVIAARLRFSDVADNVRTSLHLAKAYNEKEEFAQETLLNDQTSPRLKILNEKVNGHIGDATRKLRGITPIVSYMVYFRNAGLTIFLLVLISSSLFISGYLGWSFMLFAAATILYFNLKRVSASLTAFMLAFQVFFTKYSWRLFFGTITPGVIGFLLHTLGGIPGTDLLIALSFVLVTIFFYTWIVFMPHHDERFGDIENLKGEVWRSSRYRLIKNVFGIAIVVAGIGFAFKFLSVTGADQFMVLGLSLLSLTSYAVGFYLSRPKWLGILCGLVLGNSAIGILFKFLHLPGANEMMVLGLAFQSIFYVLYAVKRRSFHRIYLRVVMAFSMITLVILDIQGAGLFTRLNLMYSHETLRVNALAETYRTIPFETPPAELTPAMLGEQFKRCNAYITSHPLATMSIIHRRWGYFFLDAVMYHLYDSVGHLRTDPESIRLAGEAFAIISTIEQRYGYQFSDDVTLGADVLLAQGRKEDAMNNLRTLLVGAPFELQSRVRQKLESITAPK